MAPRPLLGVIVGGQLGAALRARPAHAVGVADDHVDSLLGHRQIDPLDLPGHLDPQKLPVELHVAHRHLPVHNQTTPSIGS